MGRWRRDELTDVDHVAVLRAVTGDVAALSMGERFLATVELRRRGHTCRAIAERLGIHERQVYRYLRYTPASPTNDRR